MTRYFNDFSVGENFVTSRRTLTDYDVEAFCNLTWFNLSMFFDEIYAAEEMPFRGRVLPGPFIISLALGLFLKLGFYERSIIALLGIENMKFKAPLRAGDTMQVNISILNMKESKTYNNRGILSLRFSVYKVMTIAEKELIMAFDMTHMLKKRSSDQGAGNGRQAP